MKNVEIIEARPGIRIPMGHFPPRHGWAVRLLEAIPDAGYKNGDWMSKWVNGPKDAESSFGPELNLLFNKETDANDVRDHLLTAIDIKTEVAKIGNPPSEEAKE